MNSFKSAMGYGAQSGQEPISGETGQGTASQPYDAGNIEGQSGAPAFGATSTNPTGTTQYDTGDTARTSQTDTTGYGNQGSSGLKTTENLAAGVGSDDSTANTSGETSGESRFNDTNEGAVSKGTDQGQGPDEEVTSRGGPSNDENTTAQDTFFSKAGISKDEKAAPPKVASEVADKDPFSSSSSGRGADTSTTRNETSSNMPSAPTTSSNDNDLTSSSSGGLGGVSSMAPEKGYKTADTEPHPQSSEVLSSATPGAAIGSSYGSSEPQSQTMGSSGTTGTGYDTTSTSNITGSSGSGSGYDNTYSSTSGAGISTTGGYDPSTTTSTGGTSSGAYNDTNPTSSSSTTTGGGGYTDPPTTSTTTTTAAAADTDYPSPKTQPTESQGGLSGLSHNTGSAPSAPATGNQAALEDPALGASQGQEKKKMGDRIKEKLHLGGKKE
ncbi:MAG: hypothetical protein LQ350_001099 [Teloschistes chrysophthalmus]|nr:MAG: hypothetical protein LQ350_001099 [Niorma chrysophthalma]